MPQSLLYTSQTTGCFIIRAHVFGKWREMRLMGPAGAGVAAESVDDAKHNGSHAMYMLHGGMVHPDDLGMFNRFLEIASLHKFHKG